MKKSITSILIVLILFNFIFCNRAFAVDLWDFSSSVIDDGVDNIMDSSKLDTLIGAGEIVLGAGISPIEFVWDIMGFIFGAIMGTIAAVLNLFPMVLSLCMTIVCEKSFSIEHAVFGLIGLFDLNYFNFSGSYTIGTGIYKETVKTSDLILKLKENTAKYFMYMRLIATVISLLVLIYVGIRMALSSVAEDKAKYKKMLLAWFESIILLYTMQYIMVIIFYIGKAFMNTLYNLKIMLGGTSFEDKVLDKIFSFMMFTSGWEYVEYSVVYWFLIYIQTKFFLSYMRRVITVGFLVLISPLITVTYPIDKIGDGKAQAFSVWLNEYCINIFIQPIQAMIYLVFIFTAGEIANYSIFIAAVFLLSMTKIEKMVLHLFNLRNVVSLRPVDEERKK